MAAFRRASERDMREDKNGNTFLPMKMAFQGEIQHPQRGQSQLCHTVFPGKIFGLKDPFVKGLFDIYDQNKIQGLVLDTGWLKGGVWPFQASHRAHAELWVGRIEKAWDALFAFADHATPTLVWVEEQMPEGAGTRTGGDCPQTNSNGQIIRLLRHLLALERDDNLHLLDGLPENWIYPGAELILNDLPTEFGSLNLSLNISDDGKSGSLNIDPIGNLQNEGGLNISLKTLKIKGFRFKSEGEMPDVYQGNWGKGVQLEFVREK